MVLIQRPSCTDLSTKNSAQTSWHQEFRDKISVPRFWYEELANRSRCPIAICFQHLPCKSASSRCLNAQAIVALAFPTHRSHAQHPMTQTQSAFSTDVICMQIIFNIFYTSAIRHFQQFSNSTCSTFQLFNMFNTSTFQHFILVHKISTPQHFNNYCFNVSILISTFNVEETKSNTSVPI